MAGMESRNIMVVDVDLILFRPDWPEPTSMVVFITCVYT